MHVYTYFYIYKHCIIEFSETEYVPVDFWPVRMYACMYECMYVCTYTYVCMYVCMYVYVYVYVCMYVCMYICMYVCIYVCMRTYHYNSYVLNDYCAACSYVCTYMCTINDSIKFIASLSTGVVAVITGVICCVVSIVITAIITFVITAHYYKRKYNKQTAAVTQPIVSRTGVVEYEEITKTSVPDNPTYDVAMTSNPAYGQNIKKIDQASDYYS